MLTVVGSARKTAQHTAGSVIDQNQKYWLARIQLVSICVIMASRQWLEWWAMFVPTRLRKTSDGMRYYPYSQSANGMASFAVRTDGEPLTLISALNRAIAAVDPAQTAFNVATLESRVDASLASRRLIVWLLTAFAGLALVLALVGIYGLISYVTEQRTNEIGIRMALGAQRGQVVGLVMKSALAWVGIGLVIGITMSFFAASMLKQVFTSFGGAVVSSLIVAMAALITIGGLAGLVPARRAASIDPAKTLRSE